MILCPRCLYKFDTKKKLDTLSSFYLEDMFAQHIMLDEFQDGWLVCCPICEQEFTVFGYIPEPQAEVLEHINSLEFFALRSIKIPKWIKKEDFWYKELDIILTKILTSNSLDKVSNEIRKTYYSAKKSYVKWMLKVAKWCWYNSNKKIEEDK